ncbi:MAG TPA: AMP-binding protein, partial [Usitatibacter sp.]|nr:AMP-binding protein [Usitatibacter sp.]
MKGYFREPPPRYMNLATWLERAARANPAAPAIVLGRSPWASYGELASRAAAVAGALRAELSPGERVAIAMKNSPEYLVAMYGIWWAGLAAVPVDAKLHAKEVAWIVEDAGARVVIASPGELRDLAAAEPMALAAT